MTSVCDAARHQAANKMIPRLAGSCPDNANTPIGFNRGVMLSSGRSNLLSCPLHQLTLCPIAQSVDFPKCHETGCSFQGSGHEFLRLSLSSRNGQSDDAQSGCQTRGTLPPRNRLAVRRWLRLSSLSRKWDNAGRRPNAPSRQSIHANVSGAVLSRFPSHHSRFQTKKDSLTSALREIP
jgi:hypothetical protein